MSEKILRVIFIILFTILGIALSTQTSFILSLIVPENILNFMILGITIISGASIIINAIIGAFIGFFIAPYLINKLFKLTSHVEKSLTTNSLQDLLIGTSGLFIGLIIANLVGLAFRSVPYIGPYISVVLSIVLGYIGMHLGINKKAEIWEWIICHGKESKNKKVGKLLDTNIIIDGRIADIFKTGFLEGPLVIPVFVLEELQKISDSSDILKRNRGRRGLDILNQMRKKQEDEVIIINDDFEDVNEVDSKLIKLARKKKYKIITNDYNLNKVAELQEIEVLNINDLAIAVKPVLIPGEEIVVQLIKHGKEEGQGVAYLDDGTMIVVENGSKSIGKQVSIMVTSVLQTAAGKMIFAKIGEKQV